MIVLNLGCNNAHEFEGWFASTSAFDTQRAAGQIICPSCGSTDITRRPTAPYINTRINQGPTTPQQTTPSTPKVTATLPSGGTAAASLSPNQIATAMALLRLAARQSEDVGERFPEEARRIHYGETDPRSIKGKASADDLGELLEEGIMVLPVPPDETDLH